MLRRLIFRDIFSTLRHSSEEQKEGKKERERKIRSIISRNARRGDASAISTFTRCVTEKTEDAEETLIRAHSITRIKPLDSRSESFQRRTRRFVQSALSLSFFLLSFFFSSALSVLLRFPLLSSSLSVVFITHRRHGARLHYTHIHSTVASLEKSGIRSHSSADAASPYPLRIFQVSPSPLCTAFSCFRPFLLFFSTR